MSNTKVHTPRSILYRVGSIVKYQLLVTLLKHVASQVTSEESFTA